MNPIALEGLTVRYGSRLALDNVSLAVPEGESMSAHESEILQPLRDELDATGQNENLVLFEQNYSSWYPAAK